MQFLAVLGAAIPGFVVAIMLVFAFALAVPIFPATRYVSPDLSPDRRHRPGSPCWSDQKPVRQLA